MTPVIFRAGRKDGDVTACFPTLPGSPGLATCYAHVGQHSSYSFEWYVETRPAKPEEYADLLAELQSIGYDDLRVYKRESAWMRHKLMEAERATEEAAERNATEYPR